jgi:hypothetical protein
MTKEAWFDSCRARDLSKNGSEFHPASYSVCTVESPQEQSSQGMKLIIHLYLMPSLWMNGAILLLPHVCLWCAQRQLRLCICGPQCYALFVICQMLLRVVTPAVDIAYCSDGELILLWWFMILDVGLLKVIGSWIPILVKEKLCILNVINLNIISVWNIRQL